MEEHQRNTETLKGCMDGQKLYTKLCVVKLTVNSYYIYSPVKGDNFHNADFVLMLLFLFSLIVDVFLRPGPLHH